MLKCYYCIFLKVFWNQKASTKFKLYIYIVDIVVYKFYIMDLYACLFGNKAVQWMLWIFGYIDSFMLGSKHELKHSIRTVTVYCMWQNIKGRKILWFFIQSQIFFHELWLWLAIKHATMKVFQQITIFTLNARVFSLNILPYMV